MNWSGCYRTVFKDVAGSVVFELDGGIVAPCDYSVLLMMADFAVQEFSKHAREDLDCYSLEIVDPFGYPELQFQRIRELYAFIPKC